MTVVVMLYVLGEILPCLGQGNLHRLYLECFHAAHSVTHISTASWTKAWWLLGWTKFAMSYILWIFCRSNFFAQLFSLGVILFPLCTARLQGTVSKGGNNSG